MRLGDLAVRSKLHIDSVVREDLGPRLLVQVGQRHLPEFGIRFRVLGAVAAGREGVSVLGDLAAGVQHVRVRIAGVLVMENPVHRRAPSRREALRVGSHRRLRFTAFDELCRERKHVVAGLPRVLAAVRGFDAPGPFERVSPSSGCAVRQRRPFRGDAATGAVVEGPRLAVVAGEGGPGDQAEAVRHGADRAVPA